MSAGSRFESPGEAVVAGVLHLLAQDPDLQAMVAANGKARFVEACQTGENPLLCPSTWDRKVLRALLTVKEACTRPA